MQRGMQEANELYEIYYEIYAQFKYELDEAKSLLHECEANAKDNCMMEYTMNLNLIIKYPTNSSDKTRNKKNGNPILRHFSFEFQSPIFDNEILFRQKKTFDTPIWPFFLSNFNCPYGK